jgi:GNAT superfamily N-acetyltransferase
MTDAPPITLRPATTADAERIAALFTDEGYPAGPSDIVERLERFGSPHSRVIVAEHDGEVLGFIAIHALPRFEHDDRIVRVVALVVDAGVRERGVGHLLMAEAENVGRELGAVFHRGDGRPPPPGCAAAVRVVGLRRERHDVPAEETLTDTALSTPFPDSACARTPRRCSICPGSARSPSGRTSSSSSARCRLVPRATLSGSSSRTARSTR